MTVPAELKKLMVTDVHDIGRLHVLPQSSEYAMTKEHGDI